RRLGNERALSKRQARFTEAKRFLFLSGKIVAVDPRRRIDAAQRPTPREIRFPPTLCQRQLTLVCLGGVLPGNRQRAALGGAMQGILGIGKGSNRPILNGQQAVTGLNSSTRSDGIGGDPRNSVAAVHIERQADVFG